MEGKHLRWRRSKLKVLAHEKGVQPAVKKYYPLNLTTT